MGEIMFRLKLRFAVRLLLLCAIFIVASSALAQWDVKYEEDRQYENPSTEPEVVEEPEETTETTGTTEAEVAPQRTVEESKPPVKRQQVQTCLTLPEHIQVIGVGASVQCQAVGTAGVGRTDLFELGVAEAVDIWGLLTYSIDVCFSQSGYLVFLDSAYAPRMLMPLLSYTLDGMTCGRINRPGTVVLLHEPMMFDKPLIFDEPIVPSITIPVNNCVIKLVETLFLRAAPDGEIIGLVWQNSEVPVYEINGDWYKVEFEGVTGYISRLYHNVLSSGCA